MKLHVLSVSMLLLTACGGGGSDSTSTSALATSTTPTSPPSVQVVNNAINTFDETVSVNQAVELFLYYPQSVVSNIEWTQTSGDTVTFLTPNSKGIAFTPKASGDYTIQVSFTLNGNRENLTRTISVANEQASISARLGHVVAEGNKVSLRANLANNLNTNTITWEQTAGPTITLADNTNLNSTAIFFDAPNVQQDTFVVFEVSTNTNNTTVQDTVAILIENKNDIASNAIFDERISDTFAYETNSPYKNSLVKCVYSNRITVNNICTLNELPLIAHDTTTPSVDDIMDRVVVSHQWMGDRFKTFLEEYDIHNDLKNMLRATTAIVISYDIRPSFYWGATGAIYLDANNFWLTPDERDTLNEAPDYRASFGNDLQFVIPWRYVRNNDYLSTFISEDTRTSRTADDNVYNLIGLMYHELAHANDFFPKSHWFTLDRSKRIIATIPDTIQSDILQQAHPLDGDEMYALAQVSFHGETANTTQKAYLPEDITQFFSTEKSPQYYNYSSTREDYAMLFDGFMMNARYGIERDVAITNRPGENATSSDYIVNWGQRGRIGDQDIKPRVAFVVERVLPEFTQLQSTLDNLPSPIQMTSGRSWIDNLDISPSLAPKSLAKAQISSQTKSSNIERPINEFSLLFEEKQLPKQ